MMSVCESITGHANVHQQEIDCTQLILLWEFGKTKEKDPATVGVSIREKSRKNKKRQKMNRNRRDSRLLYLQQNPPKKKTDHGVSPVAAKPSSYTSGSWVFAQDMYYNGFLKVTEGSIAFGQCVFNLTRVVAPILSLSIIDGGWFENQEKNAKIKLLVQEEHVTDLQDKGEGVVGAKEKRRSVVLMIDPGFGEVRRRLAFENFLITTKVCLPRYQCSECRETVRNYLARFDSYASCGYIGGCLGDTLMCRCSLCQWKVLEMHALPSLHLDKQVRCVSVEFEGASYFFNHNNSPHIRSISL